MESLVFEELCWLLCNYFYRIGDPQHIHRRSCIYQDLIKGTWHWKVSKSSKIKQAFTARTINSATSRTPIAKRLCRWRWGYPAQRSLCHDNLLTFFFVRSPPNTSPPIGRICWKTTLSCVPIKGHWTTVRIVLTLPSTPWYGLANNTRCFRFTAFIDLLVQEG